jgi:hypothetical protein
MMIGEAAHHDAADLADQFAASAAFERRLGSALLDAGQLHPSIEGKRARRRGDEFVVDDGPFDGTLARYYLVRAANLDAAIALADECPLVDGEVLDIRPLVKGDVPPGKLDQPGKVFALSVLGRAPDEPTWNELMERVDDDTKNNFPKEMAGGMRLESPRAGRRIVIDKSKRSLIDGPFLESKEVIGGLFFLRMPNIEDVLRWAATTRFVVHGTLEIRELWRT